MLRDARDVVGKLGKKERELALTPRTAPVADEGGEKLPVLHRPADIALTCGPIDIGFTLIPDHAGDTVSRQWRHHSVEKARCAAPGIASCLPRKPRSFSHRPSFALPYPR